MLNYRYGETECILKNKTKLDPNHSVGIIHSSLWLLGPAHSMNAVWNRCTVQWHSEFSRRSEKKHACSLTRERTKHGPPVHGLPKWITQMDYPWKSFERRKTTVRSTPHNCSYHTLRVCFGNVPYMRSVSFAPYFGRHFEMTASADR